MEWVRVFFKSCLYGRGFTVIVWIQKERWRLSIGIGEFKLHEPLSWDTREEAEKAGEMLYDSVLKIKH